MKNYGYLFPLLVSLVLTLLGCAENTRSIPGDMRKFDPVGSLRDASDFAGEEAVLLSIKATYVKQDGTVDFEAKYNPGVQYSFVVRNKKAKKKQAAFDEDIPIGAPQDVPPPQEPDWYFVYISVERPRWMNSDEYHQGMQRSGDKHASADSYLSRVPGSLASPALPLSFSKIWQKATERGAPEKNAVAVIDFSHEGYTFEIYGTPYKYLFKLDGNIAE